jgi:uncharacterized protein (DUF302 family)
MTKTSEASNQAAPTRVDRVTVSTGLPFEALVGAFEAQFGAWDLEAARETIKAGWDALEKKIDDMRGPGGLIILSITNQGEIASVAGPPVRCILYEVGNPVVATKILTIDIRACILVPFRVALYCEDEGTEGQMVYDRPSSLLAFLNKPALIEIGANLDEKMNAVAAVLMATAGRSAAQIA